jgi:hypothetical protein
MFLKIIHGDLNSTNTNTTLNYDLVECDSYRLTSETIAETTAVCEHESVLIYAYKNVNGETVQIYSTELRHSCFVLNNSGKTVDTIYKSVYPKSS